MGKQESTETIKPESLHIRYKNKDGVIIPGVTTIIDGLGWSKGALIGWTRKMMLEGKDPMKVKDKAADVGTIAHYLIHCDLIDQKPDTSQYAPADVDKAENCYIAYLDWVKAHVIEPIATEFMVISEKYQYGGTIDQVAKIDGIVSVIDFKSSNGLYPEHKIQVAAYGMAWNETKDIQIAGYHLLQLGKEDGSFHHHFFNELNDAFEVFKHLRVIYGLKNKI